MIWNVRVQNKLYKLVQDKMINAAPLNVLQCSAKVKDQAQELFWFKVRQVFSR